MAAGLAALGAAGCGGGGGEETTTAPPAATNTPSALNRQQLISQGDAICAEVNAAVGTVGSTSSGTTSQAAQVAELYSAMVSRLKSLGTPQESSGYAEFSSAADELAQAEADVKLAAERGEEGALPAAEEKASSALSSFQSAAAAYGFQSCSEGPHAPAPTSPSTATRGEEEEPAESEAVEPEAAPEPEPEAGEAGGAEPGSAGGGAATGGGTGGGTESSEGSGSGGIGPG